MSNYAMPGASAISKLTGQQNQQSSESQNNPATSSSSSSSSMYQSSSFIMGGQNLIGGGQGKGVVYFRFKHQTALEKIEFDAHDISVGELKNKIAEKTLCNRHDIRLFVLPDDIRQPNHTHTPIQSNIPLEQQYYELKSDSELIASNTNLMVVRAPGSGPKGGAGPGGKIVVKSAGFFFDEDANRQPEKFEEELPKSEIPETAICTICRWLMDGKLSKPPSISTTSNSEDPDFTHTPLLFPCCGGSVCSSCYQKFSSPAGCLIGQCVPGKAPIVHKQIIKQVEAIVANHQGYEWGSVRGGIPKKEETKPEPLTTKADEVEVLDLDDWVAKPKETVVLDLDAEDPNMTERQKRKKKRVVNLIKDEIKQQLKSEFTEEDLGKLFRNKNAPKVSVLDNPVLLTVDFPKVLTDQEFQIWKRNS